MDENKEAYEWMYFKHNMMTVPIMIDYIMKNTFAVLKIIFKKWPPQAKPTLNVPKPGNNNVLRTPSPSVNRRSVANKPGTTFGGLMPPDVKRRDVRSKSNVKK